MFDCSIKCKKTKEGWDKRLGTAVFESIIEYFSFSHVIILYSTISGFLEQIFDPWETCFRP